MKVAEQYRLEAEKLRTRAAEFRMSARAADQMADKLEALAKTRTSLSDLKKAAEEYSPKEAP